MTSVSLTLENLHLRGLIWFTGMLIKMPISHLGREAPLVEHLTQRSTCSYTPLSRCYLVDRSDYCVERYKDRVDEEWSGRYEIRYIRTLYVKTHNDALLLGEQDSELGRNEFKSQLSSTRNCRSVCVHICIHMCAMHTRVNTCVYCVNVCAMCTCVNIHTGVYKHVCVYVCV